MPQALCILAAALTLGTCVSYVSNSLIDAFTHALGKGLSQTCDVSLIMMADLRDRWARWAKCLEPTISGSEKRVCLIDYTKVLRLRIWHVRTWTITTQNLRSESNLELRIMGRRANGKTVQFSHDIYLPVRSNSFTCHIESLKSYSSLGCEDLSNCITRCGSDRIRETLIVLRDLNAYQQNSHLNYCFIFLEQALTVVVGRGRALIACFILECREPLQYLIWTTIEPMRIYPCINIPRVMYFGICCL
jgi:hypothetical protein